MEKVPCVSFSIAFMLSCLHSFPSLASLAFLPSLKVRRLFVKESSLKVQLRSFHCTFWCCLSTKETAFATPISVTLDFWSSVTLDSSVPELATIGENSNVLLSGEWPKFWMSGDLTTLFFLKLFLVDNDNDHGSSVILTVSSSSEEKESFALNLLSCSEFLAPQLGFSIISSDLWQSIDTEVKKKLYLLELESLSLICQKPTFRPNLLCQNPALSYRRHEDFQEICENIWGWCKIKAQN